MSSTYRYESDIPGFGSYIPFTTTDDKALQRLLGRVECDENRAATLGGLVSSRDDRSFIRPSSFLFVPSPGSL